MRVLKIASLIVLGLVVGIFALIGLLYSLRGTPARAVFAFADPRVAPVVGDSVFLRSIQLLTRTDLAGDHRIELLLNGNGTYPRLWQDLRSARKSIALQLYYCKPGAVADSLKRVISERARAGVSVLALFDAFGAQDLSDAYLDSLRSAGVHVAQFRPVHWYSLHKAQNRSHVRAVIIDSEIGYTGGFGIDDAWLGDGHSKDQWRDTNVRFTGAAVAQLQAGFAISWAEATGELLADMSSSDVDHARPGANQAASLLYAVPTGGGTVAERFLILSLAGARKRIWITNSYFVPDQDLRLQLVSAARRGVDVRVLTAGEETDVKVVRHAGHAMYEELLRAGVRIFEFQPTMLHAKTMVVDGVWSTVGTMNFDNRSLAYNDESNLLVHDSAFGNSMEQLFLDDLRYSREYKLETFDKRSVLSKLVDAAAGQLAKLL